MNVGELLKRSGKSVITVRAEDTVETAATVLATNNIGAVPVRDGADGLVGVLSERDIVRALSAHHGKTSELKVEELMSTKVITCGPNDEAAKAQAVMNQHRIRHLPVIEDGRLIGMISSRDVMETVLELTELERNVLRDYAIAKS